MTNDRKHDGRVPEEIIGIPSRICRRCGRGLSAKRSIRNGYGPVCLRKNRHGDLTKAKQIERIEPRTIVDGALAAEVVAAIYRLVESRDEANAEHGKWLTGEDIHELPLESFDTDGDIVLPGFGRPQWFYLHSDKYDLALWKIRIYDADIIGEMERVGDLPAGSLHEFRAQHYPHTLPDEIPGIGPSEAGALSQGVA